MKKLLPLLFLLSTFAFGAYQIIPESVSIGTSKPDVSASLQLTGVTKGFLPNKVTTTQRNAIVTPATGLMVYNSTISELQIYNGVGWATIGAGGAGGIDAWATATVYALDDVVIYNQEIYLCLIGHTSGTFATDLLAGNWIVVSDDVSSTGTITDLAIPKFVGTSGNIIGSSDILIDASNNLTGAASLSIGGSLDASAILDLTSTTKGSKPCPGMTEAQRDLISTPANGLCIYNTTSKALNIYDGAVWKAVGGGLTAWLTATVYKIGDIVIESNRIYKALTDHTAGTFATDLAANEWVELSAMEVVDLTTDVSGILPIANGGTGSATQNFVDLTTTQTVAGAKTLSDDLTVATDITLSAAQFNNVKLGNMASRLVSTGVAGGSVLTIDTDTTKFDLAIQELSFSNYVTVAQDPVVKEVTCAALNAQTVTNLATADITYILVDDACVVTQLTTYPTPQEQRLKAFIGRINHPTRTAITSVFTTPNFIVAPLSQYNDLLDALGPFNMSGNVVTPNGANLSINRSAGTIFRRGLNYTADDQNPHGKTFTAATAGNFFRSTQTAIGISPAFTTLDITNYDVGGTVTAMPGGAGTNDDSTNQRIFLLASGNMAVQYGQVIYTSLANAVAGVPNESFVPNQNLVESGVLIGVISCRKDATNASLVTSCVFSKVSRFDSSGVSVGSNSVATLQSSYDNSVTPQITTSTALGSLDIKRGSAADTDNVFRVQNGAGTTVAKISGDGYLNTTYSDPLNMLKNGGLELSHITDWTCTVGTCARTTTAGQFTQGLAALKVTLAAQSMNVSQTITTPSGIMKQGFARFTYRIPATGVVTPTITITVDSTLQVTVSSDKLLMDGMFHQIEVPFIFGSTDVKVSYLTGSSTGDVFIDLTGVYQGLGLQNLQGDTVYSANVSAAGAVSNLNKPSWITSCTVASPSVCTLGAGITLTQGLSCVANFSNGIQRGINQSASSTTTISFQEYLPSSNTSVTLDSPFNVVCQKSGNDYLAASAQVYSQASGNYSRRAYTPTFTGFGTVTGVSCFESRIGQNNIIDCKFTAGTVTVTEARVSLPGSNVSDSSIPTLELAGGSYTRSSSDGNHGGFVLREPSVGYVTFSDQSTFSGNASSPLSKTNANSMTGSGQTVSFNATIPISGWSNSSSIVGSFDGMAKTSDMAPALTSLAASNWQTRTGFADIYWSSVAYGNGLYVAISSQGTTANQIMTSPDGITWTARTSPAAQTWLKVIYGGGQFVAVSNNGTNRAMTSPDGITWTLRALTGPQAYNGIAYGNGVYVAAFEPDGTNQYSTSADGITWTKRSHVYLYPNMTGLSFANGHFYHSNGPTSMYRSVDGITWTTVTTSNHTDFGGVIYESGMYVSVGSGNSDQVITSVDGVSWTTHQIPTGPNWTSFTYAGGLFVAITYDGKIAISRDAKTWTIKKLAVNGQSVSSIATDGSSFVILGTSGTGNRVQTSLRF